MARLSTTLLDLQRLTGAWREKVAGTVQAGAPSRGPAQSRLVEVRDFGPNPGGLRMFEHVPADLPRRPALVVVLHGCGQTAGGYDAGAGWSTLADEAGFVVLCPEQVSSNNPKTCFNWFVPGHTARGKGEVASIRQMIERTVEAHGIDRGRVFVTGLSAGGAMAAALLAAYPEIFAGGGIVAGLPYGAATNVQGAFSAMARGVDRTPAAWSDLVRGASDHGGPWPRVSIWQGSSDTVVTPANARALAAQWADLHGVWREQGEAGTVGGHDREVWRDRRRKPMVELVTVGGMGHGTPLAAGTGAGRGGVPGPYLLDVGLSSTHHIAAFWGLIRRPSTTAKPRSASARPDAARPDAPRPDGHPGRADGIGQVITDALRAAGLKRT